ncbi:MAG: low molecular weight phosphotyrosine protein phosphatase [Nannocystaceae bacterium]|nr:low molecular weight phosphotyrosine protein phosphatase [Nannocystaceae bacterium]
MSPRPLGVCFVCHGNICRSPTALAVMQVLVQRAGLQHAFSLDSAGVSDEHAGELPDRRSRSAGAARGYRLESRARRFERDDFARFDAVIALDHDNARRLRALAPDEAARAKLRLLREFDPEQPGAHDVPDPWYGGAEGFELVLDLCERACAGLLAHLQQHRGLAR